MNDTILLNIPQIYPEIQRRSKEIGFAMPSDLYIGSLLKTLIASKPNGNFLELGTGIGLSLAWMVEGMDKGSQLTTVDNDSALSGIAQGYFGQDPRVTIVCGDGAEWLRKYNGEKFDLVFADAWPGKYSEIVRMLGLIRIGGIYVVDDMRQQPNWPQGHDAYVAELIAYLEARDDFSITKMNWSTGVILATRTKGNNNED